MRLTLWLFIAVLPLPGWLCAQSETAKFQAKSGGIEKYPPAWASDAARDAVPAWAQPGRIRFTRWDGGPIETAKALLSGWAGFNPPIPDYLYVMTNWYDPRTIALLREASFNTIWVTFSVGFSIETEKRQRDLLRTYVAECHRQGIRVVAYQSGANIFWEDMYERVPESRNWVRLERDGKPMPYGAGRYEQMGRVTRHLADISKPGWMEYVKKRIDLAIDAGSDAIMYDNLADPNVGAWVREVHRYATSRKKDFLIMVNLHTRDFIFNRLLNSMTTEDGREAGVFSEANVANSKWKDELPYMRRIEGGLLANNVGRFRIAQNLSEGWKPVAIESRTREVGRAESYVMSAERQQIVLGENMMFSVANETFVEGKFAHGLWYRDPEIMRIWNAIGTYNRFHAKHEEYLTGTRSLASLAMVLDNRSDGVPLLNALAARNVIYDVLYEHELTPEKLRRYSAVAMVGARYVRDRALKALEEYAAAGGKVFSLPGSATHNEAGKARPRSTGPTGGRTGWTLYDKQPDVDALAGALREAERAAVVRVTAAPGVLYNAVEQPGHGRTLVHLLNYTARPVPPIRVAVRGDFKTCRVLTPDTPHAASSVIASQASGIEVQISGLKIYSILVFEKGANPVRRQSVN